MTKINSEKEYREACNRINELLKVVGNDTPPANPNFIELSFISDLVADYEELHYPITPPMQVESDAAIVSAV